VRALLLAAGLGTRLRPITNVTPKCLVEINGRPLLDYWLELLSQAGITEVLINLHYLPDQVLAYIKTCKHPIEITTAFEETLLSTAGTVLKNRDYFKKEPFLLIHADNLSIFNMNEFKDKFYKRETMVEITMMTFHTDSPKDCGIVELNSRGIVCAFHEKINIPPSNLANGAVYIISPQVVDFISSLKLKIIDFSTQVLPHFMERINTYHNNFYHRDIGTISSLEIAEKEYPKYSEIYRQHSNKSI
jgi:mannose-1-phosphate guanylyltransferase